MNVQLSREQIPEVQDVVKATLIQRASFGDAVLLMFALCFHSVFEGIAIGVAGKLRSVSPAHISLLLFSLAHLASRPSSSLLVGTTVNV